MALLDKKVVALLDKKVEVPQRTLSFAYMYDILHIMSYNDHGGSSVYRTRGSCGSKCR